MHENVLSFKDVDGSSSSTVPLRPLVDHPSLIDEYTSSSSSSCVATHPDLYTNKFYRPFDVCRMFNAEMKKHLSFSESCSGDLLIDAQNSVKWGLCWSERLVCTECAFVSPFYKLYEEVGATSRGRKAAKANLNLQLGLQTTPMSNIGFCRVLAQTDVIPPASSGMQKNANIVGQRMVDVNKQSMHDIRSKIVDDNAKCGHKNKQAVRVEGDSCYNNPLYNSESTPFQAGTIVTTTMCENNSSEKLVIGVNVGSKLCAVASRLRNKGKSVQCPDHPGHCSANIKPSESIGDEKRWSKMVVDDISSDGVRVSHYTGDGDSKSHAGVDAGGKTTTLHLKDTRHLANTLKREVYKAPFSKNMFFGPSCRKSNIKNRFALSVKARCVSELKSAHKKFNGDIGKISKCMEKVIPAVVLCFKGYCGEPCKRQSLVCPGKGRQSRYFLPDSIKLHMNDKDEMLLERCLQILLSPASVKSTRFLTSTQKCEAVNRSYQACIPKATTFSRNSAGRIHGQILKLNLGFADSTVLKAESLNASLVKGSSVIKHLCKIQSNTMQRKSLSSRMKAKRCRHLARSRKYQLHEQVHYRKGLTDPKLDLSKLRHLNDHSYL